jgi:hypothetical protein
MAYVLLCARLASRRPMTPMPTANSSRKPYHSTNEFIILFFLTLPRDLVEQMRYEVQRQRRENT